MKTTKCSYVFVIIAISMLNSTVFSQWTPQATSLPNSVTIPFISTVNTSIAWAVGIAPGYSFPYQGFIKTTDGGMTWTAGTIPGVPNFSYSSIYALNDSVAWVAMCDNLFTGGVFKTTDGGATWVQQTTAFPGSGYFINSVYFFDADNGVCIGDVRGGYFEIYTTRDGGDQWTRVPQANIPDPLPNEWGLVSNFAASGDSTLWFGTNAGRVFRTIDRGMTWDAYTVGWGRYMVSLAFQNPDTGLAIAFLTSTVKVAKTTDGGMTWTNLPTPPHRTGLISYVPGTISSYVIASGFLLYGSQPGSEYTLDGGETWTMVDSVGHGPASFVDPYTGWSGSSNSNVIYKWTGLPLPVEESFDNLPRQISLNQNYPNPFNPETTIRYEVPKQTRVVLKVMNLLGEEVRTLMDEDKPTGVYKVMWNGRNNNGKRVASGVYLYRLESSDFVQTKKMLFIQ